jgi:integrase
VSVRPRYLDRRGFLALLRAAKERRRLTARRDYFLIYFMGRTGLRCSEALALRVRDLWLDADPPFVSVGTLKQKKKQTDQVLLDARAARAARRYLRGTLRRLLRLGMVAPRPGDPVFPAPRNRAGHDGRPPMSDRNARRIFDVYRRRAHLRPGITLHSLRHYRGTQLLRASGDMEFVRQQLRHRFISSTQRYLHVDPERERHYLARLDRL